MEVRLIVVICRFARGKGRTGVSMLLSGVTQSSILSSVSRHSPCFSFHAPSASEYPSSGGSVLKSRFDNEGWEATRRR